ncbi:glycosyltransferase [Candidatus Saccharibacteria bacterium]|nr:glycosyltransferase [Candidatus Saccharibacteria bacterium]
MERINNRPKMTLAVALLLALIVDCVIGVIFHVSWGVLVLFTVGWMFFAFLIVLFCKLGIYLRESRFDVRKFFTPKPVYKVSAVIPNYNYARYLKERVESILSQKYPIYELIILDDKSTDDSGKVIEEIIEDLKIRRPDLKVKFVPNEQNSGNVFKQWEKCFSESTGDFVWICEADDSCSKYFLNSVMRAFRDKDVVLSYSESKTIDEDGNKIMADLRPWIDEFRTGHWDKSFVNDGKNELKQFLCTNNTIANASGVVFRRVEAPIKKYLHEAQKFRLAGDWYFYSKYLLHGKIAYCGESLNYHRMQQKGVTLTTDKYKQFLEIEAVQGSIMKDVELSPRDKKRIQKYRKVVIDSFGLSEEEFEYMKKPFSKILSKSKVRDEVLLSVIVCAYNAENYIDGCLTSAEKALPEKSEIIVIDDGSTDETKSVIKKHIKECPQIKYYYKKNGGLSSAKNYGLDKASGRYVIFMDADDEIKPNGYQVMLKVALEKDADIVVCDIALIYDDGTTINCPVYHKKPGGLKGFLIDGLMASSNNKMVKRELYDKVGKYPEGLNNEDVAITPVVMALANDIQYVPSSFYKYYQRKGSIQNSEFSEKRFAIFDTVNYAVEEMRKILPNEAEDIKGIMVSNQLIALLVHVICNIGNKNEREKFIGTFCDKYRMMDVSNNKFVRKYCKKMDLVDLPDLLMTANPEQVYAYIKHEDKIAGFVDYIERAFGFKK